MKNILDDIVAVKKLEVARMGVLVKSVPGRSRGFLFKKVLKGREQISLIAEIKIASPSEGKICPNKDVVEILRTYEQNGADVISVVTDERFFGGSKELFERIREQTFLPLLRKDFIIDEKQITESAIMGADAILLIVAILTEEQLREFLIKAQSFGMECLVETHTEEEVMKAMRAGAKIIGINNRNLSTFQVDLETTLRFRKLIPDDIILVSESGIAGCYDAAKLRGKVDAILVGTAILRADDMARQVYEFKLNRPLVKVCGIQDQATADMCMDLGVEFLGFNFIKESSRYIEPKKAREIVAPGIKRVALFKDESLEIVNGRGVDFDFVQLHGSESAEYSRQVKKPVIKSFLVGEKLYAGVTPLFDVVKGSKEVVRILDEPDEPYFLAGGLTSENVCEVVRGLHPYAVDVARGVENNGRKDGNLIKEFINQLKKC